MCVSRLLAGKLCVSTFLGEYVVGLLWVSTLCV